MTNSTFKIGFFALSMLLSSVTMAEDGAMLPAEDQLCSNGKNQSPINIDTVTALPARKSGIKFNYGLLKPAGMLHTGKHLQIDMTAGANVEVEGVEYSLKHIKLHMPSEHTLNNRHFPMEIEFAHEDQNKGLLNVSMMVIPGRENRMLDKLLTALPIKAGETRVLPENTLRSLEMKKKLANYYYYSGSLTVPPCTEGVRWYIMQDPLSLSARQQQVFSEVPSEATNRPIQPLNARMVFK